MNDINKKKLFSCYLFQMLLTGKDTFLSLKFEFIIFSDILEILPYIFGKDNTTEMLATNISLIYSL